MTFTSPYLLPILLLLGSNVFMTLAWYGHLRFKEQPLMIVIVVAWAIAFVEYCMAVPANRWGSEVYTTAQLKTIQEVIGGPVCGPAGVGKPNQIGQCVVAEPARDIRLVKSNAVRPVQPLRLLNLPVAGA